MSAFNTVLLPRDEHCPRCHSAIRRRVQFKYGDAWDHDYAVGDRIRWGGNDVGQPAALVRVLGYPEECPVCGRDTDEVFDVIVRDGVIEDVVPGTTEPYVAADNATYLVIRA